LILVHICLLGINFSFSAFLSQSPAMAKEAKEPRKRGRREWTTESQKTFLTDQIPSYLAAQSGESGKSRSDFWPPLWETYFTQWPLSLVLDEEKQEGKVSTKQWTKEKQVLFLVPRSATKTFVIHSG
jgi:hypothetical protein